MCPAVLRGQCLRGQPAALPFNSEEHSQRQTAPYQLKLADSPGTQAGSHTMTQSPYLIFSGLLRMSSLPIWISRSLAIISSGTSSTFTQMAPAGQQVHPMGSQGMHILQVFRRCQLSCACCPSLSSTPIRQLNDVMPASVEPLYRHQAGRRHSLQCQLRYPYERLNAKVGCSSRWAGSCRPITYYMHASPDQAAPPWLAAICMDMSSTRVLKTSPRATKSVSELISTSTPSLQAANGSSHPVAD